MEHSSERSTSPALSISSWCFTSIPPSPSSSSSSLPEPPSPHLPFSPEFKHFEQDDEESELESVESEAQPEPELVPEEEEEAEPDEREPEADPESDHDDARDAIPIPSSPTPEPTRLPTPHPRHPDWYFDDELVTFSVEERLFRVHKYFLIRESMLFQDMFPMPSGNVDAEGQSDYSPIVLCQVKEQEFVSLLRFFYNGMYDDCGVTLPQWIDILSISTRYICDKLRERAIKEIHEHRPRINPVEKIVLSVRHNIPDWLFPSYAAICQRALPLNMEEGAMLGLDRSILLAQAREAVRQEAILGRPEPRPTPGGRGGRTGNARLPASPAPAEPEPRPSTASCWQAWEGLTVPDSEEEFDAQRVAAIVGEVFPAPNQEIQT